MCASLLSRLAGAAASSGDLKEQLDAASGLANDKLQQTATQLSSVREAASDVVTSLSGQLSDSTAAVVNGLPAPVRDIIHTAAAQASKVAQANTKHQCMQL